MKAAIVFEGGRTPVYGDFVEPQPAPGEARITVTAAAMSHVVKGRASGAHYSAAAQFPFVVGIDGVGTPDDGRRVYFLLPRAPYGGMAQRAVTPIAHCLPLPDDLDDATAIANPAMSSWAAYAELARLQAGETVLINGAAGAAGRLAVQIAKHLGARKVIGTARNADAMRDVAALGADVTIPLDEDEAALEDRFKQQFAEGVDVIVDYLWGKSAERLLIAAAKSGARSAPIRFVQIGSASGADIALPGAALRAAPIMLMGSGIGSVSLEGFMRSIGGLLQAAAPAGFKIVHKTVPLSGVEAAWPNDDSARRTVFTMAA